ncbi:MAG: sugar phosphate isomerase/epimerase [Clostridia bacterium]
MKLGISTATFFGKEVTENTFELIEALKVSCCEVFLTTFSEYLPSFGNLLKSKIGDTEVYSIHSLNLNYEPELLNTIPRTRNDGEAIYRMVLENGQKLNAKSYTFHGSARLKNRPYIFNYQTLGSRIDELYSIASEYDIALSYENVHWAYFSVPEFFKQLREFSPRIQCTLDIKQAMQAKLSYEDFLPVMQGRLNNVHLCDYDLNGALCAPGKGSVDFYKLFSMLRDIGYDGHLMVELYSQNYENYSELGDCIEYLLNILDKIK